MCHEYGKTALEAYISIFFFFSGISHLSGHEYTPLCELVIMEPLCYLGYAIKACDQRVFKEVLSHPERLSIPGLTEAAGGPHS